MKQIILLPPRIWAPAQLEAQEKVALQVAEQMADYLTTGAVTNAINMASVSAEEAPILKPYMTLGALLGRFLGQTDLPELNTIKLEFDGRAAGLNEQPVLASTLAGLLGVDMDSVNMVNAAAVARPRGLRSPRCAMTGAVIMRPCCA